MREVCRKTMQVSIVLSTTQMISISWIGLSLFQLILLMTLPVYFLGIRELRYVKCNRYFGFTMIWLISCVVSFLLSTNKQWAKSILLMSIFASFFMIYIPILFDAKDINILLKRLIQSQYITIPLSIYTAIMFYLRGGIPQITRLPFGLQIVLSKEFLIRARAGTRLRLSLPYATPPVLSVVIAICIAILLTNKELYKPAPRIFLIVSFVIILLFTGSRTGIIGLIIGLIYYYITARKHYSIDLRKVLSLLAVAIVIASIGVYLYNNVDYFTKLFQRFTDVDTEGDRHIFIPIDGILIWCSSIKNILVGIGSGSSANMIGAHTYLPPHFMNSLVTLITERGIAGLYLVFELFILEWKHTKHLKHAEIDTNKSLVIGYAVILGSCLFYEVMNCYFVLFFIAILFIDSFKGGTME